MLRLSVLMTVYNGERFLEQSIRSVLAQEFTDYEFVIVDDASSDSTPDIIAEYAVANPVIVSVHNSVNIGQTRSLNRGLDVARGKYVARLDADDVCVAERFHKQAAFLDENSSVGLVGSAIEVIDENDKLLRVLPAPQGHALLYARLMLYNTFFHSSVMARRDVMLQAGKYNESLRFAQDYDLWIRMAELAKLASRPEPLVRWRSWQNISAINTQAQQKTGCEISLKALSCKLAPITLDADAYRRFWWAYHRDCPCELWQGDIIKLQPLWEFLACLPAGPEAHGVGLSEFAFKLMGVGDFANGWRMRQIAANRFNKKGKSFVMIKAIVRGLISRSRKRRASLDSHRIY